MRRPQRLRADNAFKPSDPRIVKKLRVLSSDRAFRELRPRLDRKRFSGFHDSHCDDPLSASASMNPARRATGVLRYASAAIASCSIVAVARLRLDAREVCLRDAKASSQGCLLETNPQRTDITDGPRNPDTGGLLYSMSRVLALECIHQISDSCRLDYGRTAKSKRLLKRSRTGTQT